MIGGPAAIPGVWEIDNSVALIEDVAFYSDNFAVPDDLEPALATFKLTPKPGTVGLSVFSLDSGVEAFDWIDGNRLAIRIPKATMRTIKPGAYRVSIRVEVDSATDLDEYLLVGDANVRGGA